jgi:hypothetical protein
MNPENLPKPLKFFIQCTLNRIDHIEGWENSCLFVVDFKASPGEVVSILGKLMEKEEELKRKYAEYGEIKIKINPETAENLGFNSHATLTMGGTETRRIHVLSLNSKSLEYIEAMSTPVIKTGASLIYHLTFGEKQISLPGTLSSVSQLPKGMVHIMVNLEFSPELVEIIDEYWYNSMTRESRILVS